MAFPKSLIPFLTLMLFLSLTTFSEAKTFTVGGKHSTWEIPSSPKKFTEWAQKIRFQIGDSIVYKYDSKADSVLEVTEQDFKSCNISSPIKSYNDGNTKITLEKSGPIYYISGTKGNCEKGEKVEIRVLSEKHGHHHHHHHVSAPAPAPAPLDDGNYAPAPAPHSGGYGLKAGFVGLIVVGFGVLGLF